MSEKPLNAWRTTLKRRLAVTAALFALWALVIQGRLIYFQIFQSAELKAEANRQQVKSETIPGKRGAILDRRSAGGRNIVSRMPSGSKMWVRENSSSRWPLTRATISPSRTKLMSL